MLKLVEGLLETDPVLARIILNEMERVNFGGEAIASESYPDAVTMRLRGDMAALFGAKYNEGRGWKRKLADGSLVLDRGGKFHYGGCENTTALQQLSAHRTLAAFGLRPFGQAFAFTHFESGSRANFLTYMALVARGGKLVGLDLTHGGHLTHGSGASSTSKLWQWQHYGITRDGHMDYEAFESTLRVMQPHLAVVGGSALITAVNFRRCREIVDRVASEISQPIYLMADIAHPAGLIAARVGKFAHGDYVPWGHCHIVTGTYQKTLRGPNGAWAIVDDDSRLALFGETRGTGKGNPTRTARISELIERTYFPENAGKSHGDAEVAKAYAMGQVNTTEFSAWAQRVLDNTRMAVDTMHNRGIPIVGGDADHRGTECHLFLINTRALGLSGNEAAAALAQADITVNGNTIPTDEAGQTGENPFGIRVGLAALTCRNGFSVNAAQQFANHVAWVLQNPTRAAECKSDVRRLMWCHSLYVP